MKKNFLLFAILALNILPSFAQKASESRKVDIAVLNVLEEYERTSSFTEEQDRMTFINLFADPKAKCVFNDLPGMPAYQQMISPEQYERSFSDDGRSLLRTSIAEVRKEGEPYSDVDGIHRKISITKNVMIIDGSIYSGENGGVLFDSAELYAENPDYRLIFDFIYNPVSKKCKIASISSAEMKSPTPLDKDHFTIIIKPKSNFFKDIVSGGEKVKFNDFDQAIVYDKDIAIDSPDVLCKEDYLAESDRYDVASLKIIPIRGRLKFHGEFAPSSAFRAESTMDGISAHSQAYEAGIDIGYSIPASQIFRLGIYAGAGVSFSKLKLEAKDIGYTYSYSHPYGDREDRTYSISPTEDITFTSLFVPVYLEGEFSILNWLSLSLDIGAKAYYTFRAVDEYHVTGNFGGSVLDKEFTTFISPEEEAVTPLDFSFFGRMNIDFNVTKKLVLYTSVGYEKGMRPSHIGGKKYFDNNSGIYPIVYSESSGRDIAYRSLYGSTTISRQSLWLSLGVKLKF